MGKDNGQMFVDGGSASKASSDFQAAYWRGYISRAEVQKVFDGYGAALDNQAQSIVSLNILCGYIMESIGKTPDDFKAWLAAHAAEAVKEANGRENQGLSGEGGDIRPSALVAP